MDWAVVVESPRPRDSPFAKRLQLSCIDININNSQQSEKNTNAYHHPTRQTENMIWIAHSDVINGFFSHVQKYTSYKVRSILNM